jgi:hypothetical protein
MNTDERLQENTRIIGMFFKIEDQKYVTMVDYRSKNRFKRLIEGFSENAKIYTPQHNDNFKFVDLNIILNDAYENLENKQKASKLIFALMAQNDISIHS